MSSIRRMPFLAAASSLLAIGTPATATTLLANFHSMSPNTDFSFQIDSNPVLYNVFDDAFGVDNVAFSGSITGNHFLAFQNDDSGGGLFSAGLIDLFGAQLYTGSTSSPTILTGSFQLSGSPGDGTLTISAISAAVPEPATWAMMLLGFGMLATSMRYSRRQTKVVYA